MKTIATWKDWEKITNSAKFWDAYQNAFKRSQQYKAQKKTATFSNAQKF